MTFCISFGAYGGFYVSRSAGLVSAQYTDVLGESWFKGYILTHEGRAALALYTQEHGNPRT